VIGNAELRWFPGWRWWVVGFSGAIFYDVGSVWDQGVSILNSRYHHAVGFGIRFHNLKASGSDAIFRFDFAFNLDEKKFAGLIFTTDQLFSAFFNHRYRSPDLSGTSIDVQ
jgi:hemolysin activation/secretion protein